MSSSTVRFSPWLLAFALLAGCPAGDDDDSAVAGDDDDSAATGDDDDTAAGDDDDTGTGGDYADATAPDFAGCTGNQVQVMLGDGTVLTATSGLDPSSFSNTSGQFTIKVGDAQIWAQLNGQRESMSAAVEIPLQGPPSVGGNVILAVYVDPAAVGSSPAATAGAFGLPPANADPAVGGGVTFDALPEPDQPSSGSFHAVLQSPQQLAMGSVVLLGVSGCFEGTFAATDG